MAQVELVEPGDHADPGVIATADEVDRARSAVRDTVRGGLEWVRHHRVLAGAVVVALVVATAVPVARSAHAARERATALAALPTVVAPMQDPPSVAWTSRSAPGDYVLGIPDRAWIRDDVLILWDQSENLRQSLRALDADTGDQLWRTSLTTAPNLGDPPYLSVDDPTTCSAPGDTVVVCLVPEAWMLGTGGDGNATLVVPTALRLRTFDAATGAVVRDEAVADHSSVVALGGDVVIAQTASLVRGQVEPVAHRSDHRGGTLERHHPARSWLRRDGVRGRPAVRSPDRCRVARHDAPVHGRRHRIGGLRHRPRLATARAQPDIRCRLLRAARPRHRVALRDSGVLLPVDRPGRRLGARPGGAPERRRPARPRRHERDGVDQSHADVEREVEDAHRRRQARVARRRHPRGARPAERSPGVARPDGRAGWPGSGHRRSPPDRPRRRPGPDHPGRLRPARRPARLDGGGALGSRGDRGGRSPTVRRAAPPGSSPSHRVARGRSSTRAGPRSVRRPPTARGRR